MKNEQKQEFKSSGVLTLLGLVALSTAIIAAPWNRQHQDSQVDLALQKAEVVGYQVVQIYREAAKSTGAASINGGRAPASEVRGLLSSADLRTTGTMGSDPWGQPYHFRILSSDSPKSMRILVWSSGPNRKSESPDLEDEAKRLPTQPVYSGDDMGIILNVTKN